jgi:UDP-glucuronate 4-epimerase
LKAIVTGGAGFIGSHLCQKLLARGDEVVAFDSFDTFYDPALKRANAAELARSPRFTLVEGDIRDADALRALGGADVLVHLAARAGVRPSIEQPVLYAQVNLEGTTAVLDHARAAGIRRFVFGSSSSVYGNNASVPFREGDAVDHPISPYAATKRAGELLCHTYRHLFGLSVVCLRFFTVYGPRQRPDLAIHKFARLMLEGRPIPVFGDGSTERDYTFVDDIVQGIEGAIDYTSRPAAFEIVNLGESRTTSLARLVELLEEALGVEAVIERHPPQPGDVARTFADVSRARELLGYEPRIPVEQGIPRFVEWLRAAWQAERAEAGR